LAARRLGATVHSFDFDRQSVACTEELKRRYFANDNQWLVEQGSVLNKAYLDRLGTFDVVYSWGVLHHTGNLHQAFENVTPMVAPGGQLFIAIYNDQGSISKYWLVVKKIYNKNFFTRCVVVAIHAPYLIAARWTVRLVTGRRSIDRGMSLWFDMLDWLGGFPFEVARPEGVFRYFRGHGFQLLEMKTCGGRMGCNEFVFRRGSAP
jgi:2-polyprenyl-6-hydroxyphenyl methylase/3-demethylubiquinone-9 3-methyltransferase